MKNNTYAVWYNPLMEISTGSRIETSLPINILIRPIDQPESPWQPFGIGPGYFQIPDNTVVCIEIQQIDDQILRELVNELQDVLEIIELNLSENRKIENPGMRWIAKLTQLTNLNLSACGINDRGIDQILLMRNIKNLDISYCTRITDLGLRKLKKMRNLEELYIRGIPRIKHASVKYLERRDLIIRK